MAEFDIFFYIGAALTAVLLGIYSIVLVMFCKRRQYQPLKSTAPQLMIVSFIGNIIATTLATTMIAVCGIFGEESVKSIYHIMVIASEILAFPMIFLPYLFRAIQMFKIFDLRVTGHELVQLIRESGTVSRSVRLRKYRQDYHIKLMLVPLSIVLVVGIIIAAVNIWLATDISKYHKSKDFSVNLATMCFSYGGLILLLLYGHKLYHQHQIVLTIHAEIKHVVICCFLGSLIYLLPKFLYECFIGDDDERQLFRSLGFALLLRNVYLFVYSLMIPTCQSNPLNTLLYPETRECSRNLEIVLSTELPYLYFRDFLEIKYKEKGANLASAYTKIKLFEFRCQKGEESQHLSQYANEIFSIFLSDSSPNLIESLPVDIKLQIDSKFQNLQENLNQALFDPVLSYIMEELRECFEIFRCSVHYKILRSELKKREIIYERILEAELLN